MADARHPWKNGDEVWCRYFDLNIDGYVGRLAGHVTGVGKLGVTIRRLKPNHRDELVERIGFHDVWPSEEAIKAEIAERPGPVRPRAPRPPGA